MHVTFIGLGIMGSRMAANLLKNNVAVTVYNRSPAPVRELQKAGASAAASPHQAVQEADIVFTMLAFAEAEMLRNGDYEPQFPLELMHKDLYLTALTAYENNQPLPLLNAAKELYAIGKQSGLGREDFSAIYKTLRNN